MPTKTLEVTCQGCNKAFLKKDAEIKRTTSHFCSLSCNRAYRLRTQCGQINVLCGSCNKPLTIKLKERKKSKSGHSFCSRSCSSKYNNKIKRKSNRSKIEQQFCTELLRMFPKLKFVYNDRSQLEGYELDIYIPELKLAIEWNGIVHYQPIYGQEKLDKIQYRDYQKQLLCQKLGIDLIVIADDSSHKNRINSALIEVSHIINLKLSGRCGCDPTS